MQVQIYNIFFKNPLRFPHLFVQDFEQGTNINIAVAGEDFIDFFL